MLYIGSAHLIKSRAVALLASALLILAIPTRAAVLWSQPGTTLAHDNGAGNDVLHGVIQPQDSTSSDTFYFKFRVCPLSDAMKEAEGEKGAYLAGMVLYLGGEQHLGVGNAFKSWGYTVFNVSGKGTNNDVYGEYDLYSANPDPSKNFEYVRHGVYRTIVFKVQYIPGSDAHVTVWLDPNLALGATEKNQPTNLVTQFEAKATFNEIHLCHRGGGEGWKFDDLAIATSFEDFLVPRFWQRWWFMGLMVGILIFAAAFPVRLLERRKLHRQIQLLEQVRAVAAERERIARDIHDELGAELAQIGLLADVGAGGQAGHAEENFVRIAQRARSVVAALDEIVWAVDPRNDNLTRLADYLCQMTDECFEGSPIRFRKEVATQLPPFPISAEVRHDLIMAVKEAITNLLKHARASEVWLHLAWNEPELVISVEDNGCGFEDRTANQGNGLGNQRTRLERIGGTVELTSQAGSGTRVIFRIQLKTGV